MDQGWDTQVLSHQEGLIVEQVSLCDYWCAFGKVCSATKEIPRRPIPTKSCFVECTRIIQWCSLLFKLDVTFAWYDHLVWSHSWTSGNSSQSAAGKFCLDPMVPGTHLSILDQMLSSQQLTNLQVTSLMIQIQVKKPWPGNMVGSDGSDIWRGRIMQFLWTTT